MESALWLGLLGLLAGLLGAVAAVVAVIWGLGYREYLGGKRRSPLLPISRGELKKRLLALNSEELPYQLKPDERTDLAVEWKIADATWFAVFARERLQKTYRAYLVLDEPRKSVRYYEETGSVQWTAGSEGLGPPHIAYQSEFFKGRILFQKSWGVQYGIKSNGTLGKVYEYKFDIGFVRDPIVRVVRESGWEFVPVVRKEHADYRSLKTRT